MAHAARLNLRLQKELKLLVSDPPPGVSLPQLFNNESQSPFSLSTIEARIKGPGGTVYSNGDFVIKIQIPERYPFQPPNVTFVTPIYHPNIDNGGRICLDILNMPPKGAWQPSLNISTVLTSIGLLLSEPNPDDGLMAEASREYKYNKQVFDQKACSWTEKFAHGGASGNNQCAASGTENLPQVELEGIPDWENEGSRKKLCTSEKLSLKPATLARRDYDSDKENVARSRRLSLSCSQNLQAGSASSAMLQHSMTNTGQKSLHESDKKTPDCRPKQAEGDQMTIMGTIIVSDSEESDDDAAQFSRSKSSITRKQLLGKAKAKECT